MSVRILLLVGLAAALASSTRAQAVGACQTGSAQRFLENAEIRAAVFNTGSLFFGGETTSGDGYLIPKPDSTSSIFAAGLWLGGTVDGELRVAAARYGNYNFWPGPLRDAARPPQDCSAYDRIFVVSRQDVARYLATGELTDDLRDWPHQLGAPVLDGDGDPDNYDLRAGDQPDLISDVAAWWVMNDAGNIHPASGSTAPMGVEVRAHAFLYGRPSTAISPVLTSTTFIRYEILNRGDRPIEETYATLWSDPDLGGAGDDFVGTDTLRNMVYVYNSDDTDSRYGVPPAQGVQVLRGPLVDGEALGATSAGPFFICSGASSCVDPTTALDFRSYMLGLWPDGSPYYKRGDGYRQTGAPTTRFMFSGDPVTKSFYSEMNVDGQGTVSNFGDRRMHISTGPFRLEPGARSTLLYALPFAQGTSYLDSVAKLRGVASTLQVASANGAFASSTPVVAGEYAREVQRATPALQLSSVQPNPVGSASRARLVLPASARVRATLHDALGRQLGVLVDGVLPEGETELAIPSGLAPGRYLLRVWVEPGGEETLTFTVAR